MQPDSRRTPAAQAGFSTMPMTVHRLFRRNRILAARLPGIRLRLPPPHRLFVGSGIFEQLQIR